MSQIWSPSSMGGDFPSVLLPPLSQTSMDPIDSLYTPQRETFDNPTSLLIPEYTLTPDPLQPGPSSLFNENPHQATAQSQYWSPPSMGGDLPSDLASVSLHPLGETNSNTTSLGDYLQDELSQKYELPQNIDGSSSACHASHSTHLTPDYTTNYNSPSFAMSEGAHWGQYRDPRALIPARPYNTLDQEQNIMQPGQHGMNSLSPFSNGSSNEDSASSQDYLSIEIGPHGVRSSMDGINNDQSPNAGDASVRSKNQNVERKQKIRHRLPDKAYIDMTIDAKEQRRRELNNICCQESRARKRQQEQMLKQECKQKQEYNAALKMKLGKVTKQKEVLIKLTEHISNMKLKANVNTR